MTTPDFSKIWAAQSPLTSYEFSDEDYLDGWEFIGEIPPDRRMFDAWQRQADTKMQWLYSNAAHWLRKNSTAYIVGDIAFSPSLPSAMFLKCIEAGTTGATEPDYTGAAVGGTVTDGTVVWQYYDLLSGSGVPLGTILPYSGTGDTPPYGFLFFEGQAVSRTMYADYFDLVGTTYGEGDGETTFNLPNLIEAAMLNGSYTKTSYTTAGSATFTASKTGYYKITLQGGGGGGGGGGKNTSLNAWAGGGGGGQGGHFDFVEYLNAGDTANIVIGAGGSGGAAGTSGTSYAGQNGTSGGDSSVVVNLTTYIAKGGMNGFGQTGANVGNAGTGGDCTKNGTVVSRGMTGLAGNFIGSSGVGLGGTGGGAGGGNTQGAGVYGAGGGGGVGRSTNDNSAGGKGGDGYATIEYIGISMKYIGKVYDAPTPSSAQIDLSQYASDLANRLTREQTPAFNKRDVITTSGTYTAPVTGWYKITVKGGGGGGEGAAVPGTNARATGAGGGEGGIAIGYEKLIAGNQVSVVIGAGGAGGAIGSYGNFGGASSVSFGTFTYTGSGGQGGVGHGGFGGSGDIIGAPGGPRQSQNNLLTSQMYFNPQPGNGGGNGGGNSYYGKLGGGGAGGYITNAGSTANPGSKGGDGYVWFEYWDGSL